MGWTMETRTMPISYSTENPDYAMYYRDVPNEQIFPDVGATYTFMSSQLAGEGTTEGIHTPVHSIAVDIGQGCLS